MRTWNSFIFLLLFIYTLYSNVDAKCDASIREAAKKFPTIKPNDVFTYELAAEFKISKQTQFDFAKEYYDATNLIGRVELYSDGKEYIHYYSEDTDEGFHIQGWKCKTTVATGTPDYYKDRMTEWVFEKDGKPLVIGPSAMFLNAEEAWKTAADNTMGYMGMSDERIRGIPAHYWRRCADNMQFDYYFTTESYEDTFGLGLKHIPLRVTITHDDESNEFYPQTVDIITFQPFISDLTKMEIPTGKGCVRGEDVDLPKMPDFANTNLVIFGEVVYKDATGTTEAYDYISNFMFALNVNTEVLAYFYTPWSDTETTEPDGLKHMIYDMKNKFLYTNDVFNDSCQVTRNSKYEPKFYFPGKNGYLTLTDPSILFPNNEFSFITDDTDRNMEVSSFEAIFEDFKLGSRTVSKAIITRNYLKDEVDLETITSVKDALTSIRMELFDKKDDDYVLQNEIHMNFFGFSTMFEPTHENLFFDITPCFRRDTEFMWVTIGFPADPDVIKKVNQSSEAFKSELRSTIKLNSELSAMRLPSMLIDFRDMIYATFIVLDKPSPTLDFIEPEDKTTIETDEAEGIKSLEGCAVDCLEKEEDNCWGFSICGKTCYYGIGEKKTVKKDDCKLYRRYSNTSFEQSKETIKFNLQRLVDKKQIKVSMRPEEGETEPLTLTASYIEFGNPGDDDKLFDLVGMETNQRLRVLKVGSKLDSNAGTLIKNFGQLRYDQCQRLCLDFQQCETVSYCLRDHSCILSTAYGEDIPKSNIKEDNFCNLLTRKYIDQYERTPGMIMVRDAEKILPLSNVDDCARACVKETSFDCQSFDHCTASVDKPCRLHTVHYLNSKGVDKKSGESSSCGHYSRKYSYGFRRESFKRDLSGTIAATNITLEACAKLCYEYGDGFCYGYDFCEDKTLTQSSCTLLDKDPSVSKTSYSPICNHFLKNEIKIETLYSQGTAAWVGIICFFIAVLVGVGITFGVAYWRANASK